MICKLGAFCVFVSVPLDFVVVFGAGRSSVCLKEDFFNVLVCCIVCLLLYQFDLASSRGVLREEVLVVALGSLLSGCVDL